jgi:predicted Fe-Mo cluster-binding NifX family protein
MKIAITSSNANIEAQFSPRFGRCANFIIIDTETRAWEAIANPAASAGGGAGPQAVQFIANHGIEAVVSGRYGPNAFSALQAAGIQAFVASSGTVSELLDKFLAGELQSVSAATGPELHGRGRRR